VIFIELSLNKLIYLLIYLEGSPFVLIAELTLWKELAWASSFNTSFGSRIFIELGMKIIMMDVLWGIFTMSGVGFDTESSIWYVKPSGLRFVSEHHVGTIVPLEPSPHLVGESPSVFLIWSLMEPVI